MKKSFPVISLLTGLLLLGQESYASRTALGKNINNDRPLHSIPVPASSSEPINLSGITIDSFGRIIVTAQGILTQKRNTGQIYTVEQRQTEARAADIIAKGIKYDAFSGHVLNPKGTILYVCSNSRISTIAPSVVIFEKLKSGQFKWRDNVNFLNTTEFCKNVVWYEDGEMNYNAIAVNSKPHGSRDAIALYGVYHRSHFSMGIVFKRYDEVFPRTASITDPTAGITGIASTRTSIPHHDKLALSGQPGPWIISDINDDLSHPSFLPMDRSKKDFALLVDSIAFQDPDKIIVLCREEKEQIGSLYLYNVPMKSWFPAGVLKAPSTDLAVLKQDPYGETESPVAFVLNNQYDPETKSYSIDEYPIAVR